MNNSFFSKTIATHRKAQESPLKEAIDKFLEIYKLRQEFDEQYIVTHWEKIMGTAVANRTSKVSIENKKLFLTISSSPLRHELAMHKQKLIDLLNEKTGKKIIDEIIFV